MQCFQNCSFRAKFIFQYTRAKRSALSQNIYYKAAWISQDIMTNNHETQMYERSLITPNISTQAELVGAKYNWFYTPFTPSHVLTTSLKIG